MQKQIKTALTVLLAFFALLAAMALATDAAASLQGANLLLFFASAALFIASILLWLLSWAILIKGGNTGVLRTLSIGFACVFGAMTPIQIGADALRSLKMKELASVSYTESISASMAVKGIKFLLIALLASIAVALSLLSGPLALWVKAAMLSGFAVVSIAALLFLLPFSEKAGLKIASLFQRMSKRINQLEKLALYFKSYSEKLRQIGPRELAAISLLALASLAFEFLAFEFVLLSAGITLPLYSMLVMFSLLSVLERTPLLPRGLGVVEAAGFAFLSIASFTGSELSPAIIAAALILFDIVRLVIPTIASLAVYGIASKPHGKSPVSGKSRWPKSGQGL